MRIWLITLGEPLPTDNAGKERLFRTGILGNMLSRSGHAVTYWSSTFDHAHKRHRFQHDTRIKLTNNYELRLLHASGYRKNVSVHRILNHRVVADKFRRLASTSEKPDIILCSLPTLEFSLAATEYGRQFKVPVILDVRDLWPDLLTELAPKQLRWLARAALHPMFRQARVVCSHATAITGITRSYVDWGLRYAGRPASALDIPFPMAYVAHNLSSEDEIRAEAFWESFGISRATTDFIACWFGMIGRYSELDTVIEAARRISSTGRRTRFVLCGAGPLLEKYRRLAKSCDNVVFPGWVDATQISVLLRLSSVGLAPYVSNKNYKLNIPNKPIEYLSAGLPIVSSLQGMLAQLLTDNDCGITYANRRADELAAAIAALNDHSERRNIMAKNAVALFRNQFTSDNVYNRMQHYLTSIAASESPWDSRAAVHIAA